jgi:hypothetical protein
MDIIFNKIQYSVSIIDNIIKLFLNPLTIILIISFLYFSSRIGYDILFIILSFILFVPLISLLILIKYYKIDLKDRKVILTKDEIIIHDIKENNILIKGIDIKSITKNISTKSKYLFSIISIKIELKNKKNKIILSKINDDFINAIKEFSFNNNVNYFEK